MCKPNILVSYLRSTVNSLWNLNRNVFSWVKPFTAPFNNMLTQNSKLNRQMHFSLPSIRCSVAPPSFRLLPSKQQSKLIVEHISDNETVLFGEQGWRCGESAHFPPMCPGFDSRTRRHMWVEFVVSSLLCSQGFSPGSLVFLPPQKPTFLNSNSIRNLRATGLSVEDCCVSPSLNKVDLFIYF